MMLTRILMILSVTVLLAACGEQPAHIKIGAKNFGESRVLAHMVAELAREQNLPVDGVVDYPTTQAVLEALKRGDIDAYPDYNGTGLVMLGQNPISDGDTATERVKELYEPLGLSWRPRLGFANNYGLALRPERAAELGISTISELVAKAGELSFGIEDDFEKRPLDGLQPLLQRYGLAFGNTVTLPLGDRAQLYDRLLDGQLDLIEVYTTDGQIADYGLTVLNDDLQFFPVYQAAILARSSSLSTHQGLGPAIDALAGKIDEDMMRDLNRKVDIEGRSAEAVARDALARLGLIEAGAVTTDDPLRIAASPLLAEGASASSALRAARNAFQGRDVQIVPSYTPLQQVGNEEARLALVSADAFFDLSTPAPTRSEHFEAVAAVAQNLIHVITNRDGPDSLSALSSIAAGPEGSSSHRVASLLVSGLNLSATLNPVDAESSAALIKTISDGSSDAALIFAPAGDKALVTAFAAGNFRLLPIQGWSEGANLVRFPFLRQARIPERVYRGQLSAIDTLSSQLVLAGPAPQTGDAVGDQGPSAIADSLSPISAAAVKALNAAISGTSLIDPTLKQAAALAPALPEPPASINPAPDISILSLLVVCLFIWMVWLYARPEYR